MKNLIWIILIALGLGFSSSEEVISEQKYTNYEIVNTPLLINNDTIHINELRFYKVQSALDGMKLMYRNYGGWSSKISGKHQPNIHRIVWKNVKLLEGKNNTFTVIADGTESHAGYFACLIVFDIKGKDCFSEGHPYKEELTNLFASKMCTLDKDSNIYRIFR